MTIDAAVNRLPMHALRRAPEIGLDGEWDFQLLPAPQAELGAAHWWELPPSEATVIHLDIVHRGVGTGMLGPDTRPPYRPSGSEYAWQWRLTLEESL
ncbi:hypothetical protein AB0F17_40580 [Nonomuraea sp. NPDC026600]|uniref:hypothetical protein n=1 Tax=Nonomuraea sp. NPDC026600 TaxID=3155363 RepID=UPI0033C30C87